ANQLRDFLDQLRARLDLRDTLAVVLPAELLPADADDDVLLSSFRAHAVVVASVASAPSPDARPKVPADRIEDLHALLPEATAAANVALAPLALTTTDAARGQTFYTAVLASHGARAAVERLLPGAAVEEAAL